MVSTKGRATSTHIDAVGSICIGVDGGVLSLSAFNNSVGIVRVSAYDRNLLLSEHPTLGIFVG